MKRPPQAIAALRTIADAFGDLCNSVVFVGGAAVPLLVTDEAAEEERPTDDVDVIVEITTRAEYYNDLRPRLVSLGFKEDSTPKAPICRWLHSAYKVDIMPVDGSIFGFRGSWFRAACDTAWNYELGAGRIIRVARAPELLATKAEAFADRGNEDFVMSKDMEDFIALVNGRPELANELQATSPEVREYLRTSVGSWLLNELFLDALPGFLRGDDASQLRSPLILERLRAIARTDGQ